MKRVQRTAIRLLALGMTLSVLPATNSFSAPPQAPSSISYEPFAVVELYTSEGCSSCPPADQLLTELTAMAKKQKLRIYTLGFHVDYWNGLGWTDRFSDPDYAQRQREYAKVLGVGNVYTPQMIINGSAEFGGYRQDLARRAINESLAIPAKAGIGLRVTAGKDKKQNILKINFALRDVPAGYYLYVVLVEGKLNDFVEKGENAGKRLNHDNVVRMFKSYPTQEGLGQLIWRIPADVNASNISIIAFLQNPQNMTIAAATGAPVEPAPAISARQP